MKIRMLVTRESSEDGTHVREYLAGQEYDLSHTEGQKRLGLAFVRAHLAVEVDGAQDEPEPVAPEAAVKMPEEMIGEDLEDEPEKPSFLKWKS